MIDLTVVSLEDVKRCGLAEKVIGFIKGFLPGEKRVELEGGGPLIFMFEAKTSSDTASLETITSIVREVKGVTEMTGGRGVPIPILVNAGSFSTELWSLIKHPDATLTRGDLTLTLLGKPKSG